MTLQNLDMETLVQLNTLLQNNESESESDYENDEFLSEYDDYDDDDEFDDYDDDEDEFDDDETAEFDDYDDDDDEFIGRWIKKRRERRLKKRGWMRRPPPRVRRIPKRRPTVARVNNYASMTDLNSLISSTNKRIGALKRTTSMNARANSRNARDNAQLRRKLKAAEEQQRMTAMMTMLSPPKVKSIQDSGATGDVLGGSGISLDKPKVEFESNPLALMALMGSNGGNMNSMLPLLLLMNND